MGPDSPSVALNNHIEGNEVDPDSPSIALNIY